jgi:hypothetical protein
MRKSIDQKEHIPTVYLVDSLTDFGKEVRIPLIVKEDVFRKQEIEKEVNKELETFVQNLSGNYRIDIDFKAKIEKAKKDYLNEQLFIKKIDEYLGE